MRKEQPEDLSLSLGATDTSHRLSSFIIPTDSNQSTAYAEAFRTYPKPLYLEHPEGQTLTENKPSPTERESTPKGEMLEADTLGQ